MENNKLLSIVIATKDREYYCIEVIKTILNFNDDRIEICISDNSSTEQIKEFVEQLNHNAITYFYTNDSISSIDNFNYAMALANGEYIILLGDDDTLLPESLDALEWAKANNIDTFCSKYTHTYFWPGAHPDYHNGAFIPARSGNKILEVVPKKNLIALLKNGIVNYFDFNLPKSYHGFVRRELMEEIKTITGNYYGALSPDIFSVVALSLISKRHYVFDQVFTIAGVCKKSTTANQIDGVHSGTLEQMPHLKNRKTPYQWDKNVPEFYSVTTIWSDSGLNAINSMKQEDYLKYFNRYVLLGQALLMNRKQIMPLMLVKIEKLRKEKKVNEIIFWINIIVGIVKLCIDKGYKIISNTLKKRLIFQTGVEDIKSAMQKYGKSEIKS